jgi:hypothetical protein
MQLILIDIGAIDALNVSCTLPHPTCQPYALSAAQIEDTPDRYLAGEKTENLICRDRCGEVDRIEEAVVVSIQAKSFLGATGSRGTTMSLVSQPIFQRRGTGVVNYKKPMLSNDLCRPSRAVNPCRRHRRSPMGPTAGTKLAMPTQAVDEQFNLERRANANPRSQIVKKTHVCQGLIH